MAVRTVTVALQANVAGFTAAMGKASAAAKNFSSNTKAAFDESLAGAAKVPESYEKIGSGLLKMGAAGAAGLTLVTKAAMDWESSFAGVRKTVDATESQYAELNDQLRELARTLPASHSEIGAVAEAAGQLGVAREDVSAFTKTMIDLGETTNLSAEEAATTLARFSNIMGTATSDVDRLGSVIVDLGNNYATTEAEIASMGLRIAGAGRQIGLSEANVLGLSAALSSVGIQAEAGGTAISRFLLRMESQVRDGGEELQLLADIAGMTADEFARAFQEDASGALVEFVEGLGRAQAAGEDTSAILTALGVDGIREADALRRLASAGDLLSGALETGTAAWEENLALAQEAAQRYGTTESKVRIAWNNIKDAAIDAGQAILPVVATVAEAVAAMAQGFGNLSPGMKTAAVAAVAVVTAVALLGGAFLTLLPKVVAAKAAMNDIRTNSPRMAAGVGKVSSALHKAAGVASAYGLAMAAAAAAGKAISQFQPKTKPVIDYENALLALAKGGEGASEAMNKLLDEGVWGEAGTQVTDLSSAFKQLAENQNFVNESISKAGDALGGLQTSQRAVQAQFVAIDQALQGMDSQSAAKAFREIAKAADEAGVSNEALLETFPEYKARMTEVANQLKVTGLSAQDYVDWMGGKVPEAVRKAAAGNKEAENAVKRASGEMRDAVSAAQAYYEALEKLAEQTLAASNSEIGYREAVQAASDSIKENGKNLDLKTKKGRENQKALNALSASGRQWIADLEKESRVLTESGAKASEVKKKNEELERAKREVAAQIARTAREMGLENKEAVELAKKLNAIPDEVSTSILLPGAKGSQKQADKLNERMKEMDARDRLEIVMEWMTNGYEAANKKYKDLKDKTVNVTLRYQETGQLASGVRVGNRVVNLGGFADGGPVPGRSPHPKADDKIIRVTSGEFMMQHSSHSKYGTDTLQRINRGEVDPAALSRLVKGFADGGPISHAQQGPMATERQTLTAQSVPAGRTTNQNTFVLPNVNPYALLAAAGHRLEGLR